MVYKLREMSRVNFCPDVAHPSLTSVCDSHSTKTEAVHFLFFISLIPFWGCFWNQRQPVFLVGG